MELNAIECFDDFLCTLDVSHCDEPETSRSICSCIVDNGHLGDGRDAAKLVFEIALSGADAQTKHTNDFTWFDIGRSVSWSRWGRCCSVENKVD